MIIGGGGGIPIARVVMGKTASLQPTQNEIITPPVGHEWVITQGLTSSQGAHYGFRHGTTNLLITSSGQAFPPNGIPVTAEFPLVVQRVSGASGGSQMPWAGYRTYPL